MNQPKKLSRRDWFRLRVPRTNKSLGNEETTIERDVLTPIEHPPNHDGLDLAALPPMREAVLSIEQVESLFSDISDLATDIQLMQRTRNANRATAKHANSAEQLNVAKAAMLTGSIPRMQIRYRWEESLWIDTLSAQSDGVYKLVRIAHVNQSRKAER
ncbi:MAG: hypothetical protein R3C03_04190 [Pirellulaceae bacterium]